MSELWLGAESSVEWYSAITSFVAIPRFIPPGRIIIKCTFTFFPFRQSNYFIMFVCAGLDAATHEGFPAFGPDNDLLPLDVNVTFFFDYDKGSFLSFNL